MKKFLIIKKSIFIVEIEFVILVRSKCRVEGIFLILLKDFYYLFFNRTFHHIFIDSNFFGLANSMNSLDGLIFNRWIKPRFCYNNIISCSEVKSNIRYFNGADKYLKFFFILEFLQNILSLFKIHSTSYDKCRWGNGLFTV